MFRRETSLGYLSNHLARLFIRALDRRIESFGLVHGQFPALLALWEQPGRTQAEIARLVAVEQPTMANTLNRMERDGLIERRPDPADRRRMLVYPTPRAMEMREAVLAEASAVNARAAEGFSPAETEMAQALLRRMIVNLSGE